MTIVKEYILDYCIVQCRDDNIVLLEINDGIDVNAAMVAELTQLANENMDGPFGLLSNRINSYSLSFEAMKALAYYENLVAVAIITPSVKSHPLVEAQNALISTLSNKPIEIFMEMDPALNWLYARLRKTADDT